MTLKIAADLDLPLHFATEASAILARRGRGKTYTARVLAEELCAAGQPFVLLDPVGVSWGLRSSADGAKPGLKVKILGGEHGDVPLEQTAGALIATFVVDNPGAYVIDLSGFEVKAAQDRFVADFAERIYRYKAAVERRVPVTLIIDEADQFAPQQPRERGGYGPRMLGALESIVRQGRARGLGCVLITQRPAVLNKNVLTQAGALILLGITGPQDRKAIDDWVRGNADDEQRRQVIDSLASLAVGEAWVWWPTEDLLQRVKIRTARTFDSSSTPTSGATHAAVAFADVDLDALKDAVAASVEKSKAEDPKLLHAQIRDLERELTTARKVQPQPEPVVERVEVIVPVLHDEQVQQLASMLGAFEQVSTGVHAAIDQLAAQIGNVQRRLDQPPAGSPEPASRKAPAPTPRPATPAPHRDLPADSSLPDGEHKILVATAQHTDGVTREQLTILTGYKRSTRDAYIQRLRNRDLLEVRGATIHVTQTGLDALGGGFEPLPTGAALREYWLARLPEGEGKILAELVDAYPAGVTRDELSDRTGYKRSTRDAYIQRLRTRQLVTIVDGNPRASDVLFEEST